jgi:hypothetical protein
MADPLATLLVVAAILVVLDVVLAGGAMTMAGVASVASVGVHPVVIGLIVVLVAGAILVLTVAA